MMVTDPKCVDGTKSSQKARAKVRAKAKVKPYPYETGNTKLISFFYIFLRQH